MIFKVPSHPNHSVTPVSPSALPPASPLSLPGRGATACVPPPVLFPGTGNRALPAFVTPTPTSQPPRAAPLPGATPRRGLDKGKAQARCPGGGERAGPRAAAPLCACAGGGSDAGVRGSSPLPALTVEAPPGRWRAGPNRAAGEEPYAPPPMAVTAAARGGGDAPRYRRSGCWVLTPLRPLVFIGIRDRDRDRGRDRDRDRDAASALRVPPARQGALHAPEGLVPVWPLRGVGGWKPGCAEGGRGRAPAEPLGPSSRLGRFLVVPYRWGPRPAGVLPPTSPAEGAVPVVPGRRGIVTPAREHGRASSRPGLRASEFSQISTGWHNSTPLKLGRLQDPQQDTLLSLTVANIFEEAPLISLGHFSGEPLDSTSYSGFLVFLVPLLSLCGISLLAGGTSHLLGTL
ncbi:nascent polypeptide-associated complex subunit alpha, muscle-specific form-like [Calypte anna]|uniref:nascent polypeptide-associated complex subunit alpha, muscle-specific form-like n=1 Tax=Calypte anna TaxID=9244 RepID=UPI0011C49083|nr:nascent polypeptide-associated complex subunit alpha, muscle-specific form-like [Calypte anna]